MTGNGTYTVYGAGIPVIEDAPASRATIIYTRLVFSSVPARMVRTDGLMPVLVAEYDAYDLDLPRHALSDEAKFSPVRWGYALGQIEAMGGLHPLGQKDAAEFAMLTGDKPLNFQWTEFERSRRPAEGDELECPYTPECEMSKEYCCNVCASGLGPCPGPGLHTVCLTHKLECPWTPECEISEEYCCNGCASGLGPCFGPGLHPVCLTHQSAE